MITPFARIPTICTALVRSLTDPTFGDICLSFEKFDGDTRRLYTSHQFLIEHLETSPTQTQLTSSVSK